METETATTMYTYVQSALFYSSLSLATVLAALYFYSENLRSVKMGNKLPGPKKLPIIGNALLTVGVNPNQVLDKVLEYDVYGPVVRAFLGWKLIVFLYHPADVEIILNSSVHIDKSPEYRYFEPWLGNGLLINTGDKWRRHRKIIAPTFHQSVLKGFVPLFFENSRDLVHRLKEQVGKEFDVHDYLASVTVDILLSTAMGAKWRTGPDRYKSSHDYAMAVMKLCDIIHQRQYKPDLRYDLVFNLSSTAKEQTKLLDIIHGLSTSVVNRRKAEVKEIGIESQKQKQTTEKVETNVSEKDRSTGQLHYVKDDLDELDNDIGEKRRLAFLDQMLDLWRNGTKMTEEEIQEEVDTILFEGHDTTSAGSSFVLCILGVHQDVQAKIHEEMDRIFKGSNRPCTFEDTLDMKYLERVILETLRLYPPVPAIARMINEDVKIVTGNHVIPKGTTVLISPFKIHRLEEFYPNAEKFNPDNFLPEKMQNRHYYSFIPFSAGPRSCVGRKYAMLKLKVLLSTVLRNYRILSDLTEKDFRLRADIILKRADGFRVKIEPRNNAPEIRV
ncbi:cytochrome P450 4g15-like [Ceratina calcarata]|uniref:Cytochrome P450 4g15-like n=1 Tax=Ceratina calcarata TaxID=156304 RepID=A0AAJ7S2L0_9HYME|nr:cytochrome P450 4g15-like [Ceratina calcarata]XP_026670186.1 cytochrome P450 4g15-like [Ceratina calcarata]